MTHLIWPLQPECSTWSLEPLCGSLEWFVSHCNPYGNPAVLANFQVLSIWLLALSAHSHACTYTAEKYSISSKRVIANLVLNHCFFQRHSQFGGVHQSETGSSVLWPKKMRQSNSAGFLFLLRNLYQAKLLCGCSCRRSNGLFCSLHSRHRSRASWFFESVVSQHCGKSVHLLNDWRIRSYSCRV